MSRPDAVDVVLDDGDAAGVAGISQPLVDLLGAVRVRASAGARIGS
jgi:hypothetical protein